MLDRMREALCGLRGHDNLLQFEPDRIFLMCVSCGHESHGWVLDKTPPTVVSRVDNRRPALVRHPLLDERRIA